MTHFNKKLWVFGILLVIVILFWSSLSLQEEFSQAVSVFGGYIQSHQVVGLSVFFLFAALSVILGPFTSVPLVPIAITVWGRMETFVLLLSGWLVGGVATYLIGKYAAYAIFKKVIPFGKIEAYRKKISAESEFFLIVLFRLMLPAEIPGYLLGIIRYDFTKYWFATFLGELPFAIIVVFASEAFLEANPVQFAILIVAELVLIGGALYFFQKRLR